MKYVYFIGAALCGLLAVCAFLTIAGVADFGLELKDGIIGILGVIVGAALGLKIHNDEKNTDGPFGRLR